MALTDKQKQFCLEYIVDLNATQAAIRAGYSGNTAAEMGYENLQKGPIKAEVERLKAERWAETGLSGVFAVKEMMRLAYWNVQDFLDEDNSIKKLKSLPRELTKPIIGLKVKETFLPDGTKEVTTELKFVDKKAAQSDLLRHLGEYEADNNQGAVDINAVMEKIQSISIKTR